MPEPGDTVWTKPDPELTAALAGARITKICRGWCNNQPLWVIETDAKGSEPESALALSFTGTCCLELHDVRVEFLPAPEEGECPLPT